MFGCSNASTKLSVNDVWVMAISTRSTFDILFSLIFADGKTMRSLSPFPSFIVASRGGLTGYQALMQGSGHCSVAGAGGCKDRDTQLTRISNSLALALVPASTASSIFKHALPAAARPSRRAVRLTRPCCPAVALPRRQREHVHGKHGHPRRGDVIQSSSSSTASTVTIRASAVAAPVTLEQRLT